MFLETLTLNFEINVILNWNINRIYLFSLYFSLTTHIPSAAAGPLVLQYFAGPSGQQ